jgi:hypothetical protein
MDRCASLGRDKRIAAVSLRCESKSSLFGTPPLPHVPEDFESRYNVVHPLWDGSCSRGIEGGYESSARPPNPPNFDWGSGCFNPTSIGRRTKVGVIS